MKVSRQMKRNAALRVAAGSSTEAEEAARLKVHRSTVSRAVAELAEESKPAPNPATQRTATSAPSEGKTAEKTPLEMAREAAAGPPTKEATQAIAQAGLDDAKFCIETLQNYKAAGVYLVAQFSGVPADDKMLPAISPLSEMAKGVIAQNASWLAPMLRQQGGKEALYVILGIEALLAYVAIRGLVKKYAPKEEETPKDEKAA